ncbi:MAG: hypothetical protein HKN71_07335 [Gemmatimonadetes bacterium]|nr:hypothetical protein [Gemmatimonadota bacterium]
MNPATFGRTLLGMMRWSVIALVLIPVAAAAQVPVNPSPRIVLPGGAEAEGCSDQWATRAAVHAYSAATAQSRRLRTVGADRRVDANDYSESLTVVLEAGFARATRAIEVTGVRLGTDERVRLALGPGDVLTILADGPEESVYVAVEGVAYAGFVPGYYGGEGLEVVRRPATEVWVRLVAHSEDRPAAWLNTAQAGMVPREPFCL